MKNKDMIFVAILALAVIIAWAWMERYPANIIRDTTSPLPVNLKTNGNLNGNGMDIAYRTNFQQQPNGGSFS